MVGAFLRHPRRAAAETKARAVLEFAGLVSYGARAGAHRSARPAASDWRSRVRWRPNPVAAAG